MDLIEFRKAKPKDYKFVRLGDTLVIDRRQHTRMADECGGCDDAGFVLKYNNNYGGVSVYIYMETQGA